MKQDVINLFNTYPQYAFLVSIGINVIVAILGVIPSVFLTAANILFFGFWQGTAISFAGESVGALVAFLLYRIGFKRSIQKSVPDYKPLKKLLQAQGMQAFSLIILLRLIPLIPSGIVTFTAAISRIGLLTFFTASSIGKIPALLIEAYAAYQVTEFGWQGKVILLVVAMYLLYQLMKRWR